MGGTRLRVEMNGTCVFTNRCILYQPWRASGCLSPTTALFEVAYHSQAKLDKQTSRREHRTYTSLFHSSITLIGAHRSRARYEFCSMAEAVGHSTYPDSFCPTAACQLRNPQNRSLILARDGKSAEERSSHGQGLSSPALGLILPLLGNRRISAK